MRLFIAIPLSETNRDHIMSLAQYMKSCSDGNYTRRENLHITLEFLGDVAPPQVSALIHAMDSLRLTPFDLLIGRKLGNFRDLWWLSIEGAPLLTLYNDLHLALKGQGISLEERSFRPHLTVVRELRQPCAIDMELLQKDYPALVQHVDQITLFQSERINGRLTYTALYSKCFEPKHPLP